MKKLLLIGLLIMIVPFVLAEENRIFTFEFSVDKQDNFELTNFEVTEGTADETTGDYNLVILDSSNKELSKAGFTPLFEAWAQAVDGKPFLPNQDIGETGSISLTETSVVVKLPFSDDAAKYQVKKGTSIIKTGNIDLCNEDGKCDMGENFLSCYMDCPSGSEDGYCDAAFDEICDVDCKNQGRADKDTDCSCGNNVCDLREDKFNCPKDCGKPINMFLVYGIGAVVILILIIVGIVKLCKKKKHKKK